MQNMGKLAWLALLTMVSLVRPAAAGDDLITSQWVDQARYWQQKNRDDIAADLWRKLLRTDPKHLEALIKLGTIEARAGNLSEAEALYNRATQLATPAAGLSELSRAITAAKGLRKDLPPPSALPEPAQPGPEKTKTNRDKGPVTKVVSPPATQPPQKALAKPAKVADPTRRANEDSINTATDNPKLKFSTSLDPANVKPHP